jgi:hypothetical protein
MQAQFILAGMVGRGERIFLAQVGLKGQGLIISIGDGRCFSF